ncbi:nitronate monooxygenase [Leucobacter sp. BZR 635]
MPLDPLPRTDDDAWGEKIALLREDPVPVVSLTFGLPAAGEIRLLQRAGSAVLATVTTPAEAREAADAGVDGLVVQGPRAGGHSASWDPARRIVERSTSDALAMVRATTKLPLIAAGGVDGADAVRELRDGGATAVAVGTLLLRTAEAGTSQPHRDALASGAFTETALTRVFTGRPARALRNGFVSRHEHEEITAYPAVHHLTRGLRKRAAAAGDTDRLHLWAGTGFREAREEPVAATIARLLSRI